MTESVANLTKEKDKLLIILKVRHKVKQVNEKKNIYLKKKNSITYTYKMVCTAG